MRIGVDTGGTFTDVVAAAGGVLRVHKLPSTPGEPARAILDGVMGVGGRLADAAVEVVHGTTVATNALLERRGGPTAFVTTAGFEDLLVVRRQNRPRLYALHPVVPAPLSPDELCFGVAERLAADGSVVRAPAQDEVEALVARLGELVGRGEVRSIAVALLHAYANASHEQLLGSALARLGVPVSLSSEVLPEHREYERASTTVVDAYVAPIVRAHVATLAAELPSLRLMQSSGGAAAAALAGQRPVTTILSGPAAGVVGARAVAAALGFDRIITFDMGGTSTDVSLVDRSIEAAPGADVVEEVGGVAVRVPALPVHTVGAGGGSIAWRDPGGALKVGPRSAGARPGPACYGLGGLEATVTDAALVLGRIAPDRFLGGAMALDPAAARRALAEVAGALGLELEDTAEGVLQVAVAVMARAIRVVSVERGHDPRDFTLVAFGGAGPMFACDVAAELDIPRVLVPPAPGLLCAYGALCAEVTRDHVATRLWPVAPSLTAADLAAELAPLEDAARAALDAERIPRDRRRLLRRCDLRYRGQSHELSVVLPPAASGTGCDPAFEVVAAFHALHARCYGFASAGAAVERVALRVQGSGLAPEVPPLRMPSEAGPSQVGSAAGSPVVSRPRLGTDAIVEGPAMIVEYSGTTWLPAGWRATVLEGGALLVTRH